MRSICKEYWSGLPCQAEALTNGTCKNHDRRSFGPKTPEGRHAIAEATRRRMASGGRLRVFEGFYRWLEGGAGRRCLGLPKTGKGKKVLLG